MKKTVKKLKDLSPDVKAYIYQQINDFTPFFLPDSNVNVLVEEETQGLTKVKMTLTGGGTFIESEGRDENIYKATLKAKNSLFDHLINIQKSMFSEQERKKEVDFLLEKAKIH